MALTATLASQTGPKGFAGARIRYGSGVPTHYTTANEGDLYRDNATGIWYGPRAGGLWPVFIASSTGYTGPDGQTTFAVANLSQATGGLGPLCSYAGTAATATVPLCIPGTPCPQDYFPTQAGGLHSVLLQNASNSGSAAVFKLVDTYTGTTVYTSPSVPVGGSVFYGPFSAGTYPTAQGDLYRWTATFAAAGLTVAVAASPSYFEPSTAGQSLQRAMPAVIPTSLSLGGAQSAMYVPGTTALTAYVRPYQAGYLHSGTITNNTSSSCTATLNSYSVSCGANATASFGPLSALTQPLGAGSANWVVSGNGTGGITILTWYAC